MTEREGILIPRKVVEQLVTHTEWTQEYYGCVACLLGFKKGQYNKPTGAIHKDDCPFLYLQQVLGGGNAE